MELAGEVVVQALTVYKISPLHEKQYVNKYVEIVATDGAKFSGIVFTVDPLTQTIVLVQKEDETLVDIIMGHAVQSINIIESAPRNDLIIPDNMFTLAPAVAELSAEEIVSRKNKLKSWLLLNKVHVEEDGSILRLHESIEFHPPYGKEDCRSLDRNELILGRILDLLGAMPE